MAQRKPLVWIGGRRRQLPAGDTLAGAEPPIEAGDTQQYYRGDKSWASLASAVRAVVLTGLSTATNAAITATDTVLQALGKLQAQLDNRQPLDATLTALAALNSSANQTIYSTGPDAYALTSLTVYGRQLIGTADAPAARSVLALGAAATYGVTTSPTDTTGSRLWRTDDLIKQTSQYDVTPGRVLLGGAFGLGTDDVTQIQTLSNFSQFVPTGFYRALGDGAASPTPNCPPGSGNNQLLVLAMNFNNFTVQYLCIANSATGAGKRVFFGNYYTGTTTQWTQATHAGHWITSLDDVTADRLLTVGYQGLGGNCRTVTDWNNVVVTGFYMAFNATNAPVASTWFAGEYIAHNSSYGVLTLRTFTSNLTRTFKRVKLNGAWQAWVETTEWGAGLVTVSATSKTLTLTDVGTYQRFTNTSASTCTVPTNAGVAYPTGSEIHIRRAAAANLTIAAASGVTINAPSGGTLVLTNNMTVTLKKVATDTWDLIGQTVPA
ncbi:pyocin knob domain-containing protein [Pseudomonas indica]|uniref:pyocin knob domain-containing protein n=1 Tax=Pseudomonas indica TaxID=137658 RepID=UPI003FD505F5